jgi:hypothetical protein
MYACGLRIAEAANVEIGDIEIANGLLRVIGKGDKELVPLPESMLAELRRLGPTHRNKRWLCPDRTRMAPVSKNALWRTFRLCIRAAGITRPVSPHSLRHSYATRLLESGVGYTGGADPVRARQHRDDGCLPASDRADANLAQGHPRQVDDRPLIQSPIRQVGNGRARRCSAPLCAGLSVGIWRVGAAFARAIADILACRTEQLGGHLWRCDCCRAEVFSYHSCKNRSCPRCHKDQTERWIAARKAELLACPYFHVTVTVPEELRNVLRANQRDGYTALMRAVTEGIIELAHDRGHVRGTVGVIAELHTWTQQLI